MPRINQREDWDERRPAPPKRNRQKVHDQFRSYERALDDDDLEELEGEEFQTFEPIPMKKKGRRF